MSIMKGGLMRQENNKSMLKNMWKERKILWNCRHINVEEALDKVSSMSSLKFLMTGVGVWVLLKEIIAISIVIQLIYWFSRFSKLFF